MFFTCELRFWLAEYEHSTPILKEGTKAQRQRVTDPYAASQGFCRADSRGQCAPTHLFHFLQAHLWSGAGEKGSLKRISATITEETAFAVAFHDNGLNVLNNKCEKVQGCLPHS